ncbi:unnamed protein product [Calicophoron daubneyi]|uniref:Uncharacterized protein n=1 Tax=Calicophoron daubneyi TaxID=300641 RepID=A0AAV2TPX5_CALDB
MTQPVPDYLDRERLAMAVFLARRDVAQMRLSLNRNIGFECLQPSTKQGPDYNVQPANSDQPTRRFTGAQKVSSVSTSKSNIPTRPPTITVRHVEPYMGDSTSHRPEVVSGLNPSVDDTLPVRTDSPPVRDTDAWVPSRSRPLHEPTARQLQNAQESHLRQLRNKIARYSSAIAELQIHQEPSKSLASCLRKPTLQTKNLRRIPKINLLRHQSKQSSSLLRPQLVPLCRKTPQKSSLKVANSSRSSLTTATSPSTLSSSPESLQPDVETAVNELWAETVHQLYEHNPELVILKPEDPNSPQLVPGFCQPIEERINYLLGPEEKPCYTDGLHGAHSGHIHPQPEWSPTVKSTEIDLNRVLEELEEAESEEAEIRRRWAHLSLGTEQETQHPLATGLHPVTDRALRTEEKAVAFTSGSGPLVNEDCSSVESVEVQTEQNLDKDFKKPPIIFTKNIRPPFAIHCRDQQELKAVPSHTLSLRLPIKLHRRLLCNSSAQKLALDRAREQLEILTAPECRNLRLVRVCEWFTDEIVENIVNEIVIDIEKETSSLIDQLVEGELFSEPPESTLVTDNESDNGLDLSTRTTPTPLSENDDTKEDIRSSIHSLDRLTSIHSTPTPGSLREHYSSAGEHNPRNDHFSPVLISRDQTPTDVENSDYSMHFEKITEGSEPRTQSPLTPTNPTLEAFSGGNESETIVEDTGK